MTFLFGFAADFLLAADRPKIGSSDVSESADESSLSDLLDLDLEADCSISDCSYAPCSEERTEYEVIYVTMSEGEKKTNKDK